MKAKVTFTFGSSGLLDYMMDRCEEGGGGDDKRGGGRWIGVIRLWTG